MSQKLQLLNYLKRNKTITKVEAFKKLGIWNSGGRICDLRNMGYKIETHMIESGNKKFALYEYKGA